MGTCRTIEKIIEAGRLTPTAKNLQNISYIVLQGEKDRFEKMAVRLFKRVMPVASLFVKEAKNRTIDDHFFFKKAPVAILIVSDGTYSKINGSLAASNMALMAEACGLGVLYSGLFTIAANLGKLRRSLGLKPKEKVVTTLVLGYPNVTYRRTAQRETADIRYI